MILPQKSEPEDKWPTPSQTSWYIIISVISFTISSLEKKEYELWQELDLYWAATLYYYEHCWLYTSQLWFKNSRQFMRKGYQQNAWMIELWSLGEKQLLRVEIWCDCVLLVVNRENLSEVPYNKQKEFRKITEKDGRVRTGDWIQKV